MKMRHLLFTAILFCLALGNQAQAQSQGNPKESPEYKRELGVYNLGKRYNDFAVVRLSLYNLIALDPGDVSLLDSLALYYFEYENYASAALVSNDIILRQPNNLLALEINGLSMETLGIYDNALNRFEQLYLKEPNINALYKIAFLQFNLKRFTECATSLKQIMEDPESLEEFVQFGGENRSSLNVTMHASAKNLLALVKSEQGQKEEAIRMLEEILKEYPTFLLAQENLKLVREKQ
jgi:tetratricopeptide (TPR) repeat protein